MSTVSEQIDLLAKEIDDLRYRYELSKKVGPEYFEPGMMEYLDQSYGSFDRGTGQILLRFEAKGTRYEGRTERIENVHVGDTLRIIRENDNEYNANNFMILAVNGQNLGNVPASLCNALAPLIDSERAVIDKASVSFVDPISKRGRHARQSVLFVELQIHLTGPYRS